MASYGSTRNVGLQERLAGLRDQTAIFRESFEALVRSLSYLEQDALCDKMRDELFQPVADGCSSGSTTWVKRKDSDFDLDELPGELTSRWDGQSVSPSRSNPKRDSEVSAMRSGCQEVTKLHERWDHMYVANELAITGAELAHLKKANSKGTSIDFSFARPSTNHLPSKWACNCKMIHPYSRVRILWDIIGTCLVLLDVFLLPVSLAWSMEFNAGSFEHKFLSIGIIYWSIDIVLSFNTASVDNAGKLISIGREVAIKYLRGWFFLDVLNVNIDCFMWLSVSTSLFTTIRGMSLLRMLRLARGLRLMKVINFTISIENLGSVRGQEAMVLVFVLFRTLGCILSLAHVLACVWYAIGRTERTNGNASWLDSLTEGNGAKDEYLKSFTCILGYLTANPIDSAIVTVKALSEHLFMLVITLLSLVVLGGGISKITETMLAMERINHKSTRAKRVLERFFTANKVPVELRMRVVGFVLHKVKQTSETSLEAGIQDLLSSSLYAELLVSQRLKHVLIYPLFEHFHMLDANITLNLVQAFESRSFAEADYVFLHSTWAENFVITRQGTFLHVGSAEADAVATAKPRFSMFRTVENLEPCNQTSRTHSEATFFAEYSLYAKALHDNSLQAKTMADILQLSGHGFAESVSDNPLCIGLVCNYARLFIAKYNRCALRKEDVDAVRRFSLSGEIMSELLDQRNTDEAHAKATYAFHREMSDARLWNRSDFLTRVYNRAVSLTEIGESLEWLFPELGPGGMYNHFGEEKECNRCKCAILSIIYLHFGAYEELTCKQPASARLTHDQWAELQEMYGCAVVDMDKFNAVLVLLAIRGLGKVDAIASSVLAVTSEPASAVSRLMDSRPHFVPSAVGLNDNAKILLSQLLRASATFNMAQFLQAENNPSQIEEFKTLLEQTGNQDVFRCYMLVFIGMMCSLRGDKHFQCSLHLDKTNGAVVLLAIRSLQDFERKAAQRLYWSFIKSRARDLGMPIFTIEDLVLARLACLIRATREDCATLFLTWRSLFDSEREHLTQHFLADGIVQNAVLFSFLPLYLTNAKQNPCFGLCRALSLMVEFLERLYATGQVTKGSSITLGVNLQRLAAFILEVESSLHIDFLGAHISFVEHGAGLLAVVSGKMHRKLKEPEFHHDSIDDKEIAYALRRLEQRTFPCSQNSIRMPECQHSATWAGAATTALTHSIHSITGGQKKCGDQASATSTVLIHSTTACKNTSERGDHHWAAPKGKRSRADSSVNAPSSISDDIEAPVPTETIPETIVESRRLARHRIRECT